MSVVVTDTYGPSNAPALRQALPPVECTDWCIYGDGHQDVHDHADQHCFGPAHAGGLTLHTMVQMGEREWILEYVQAYLTRDNGTAAPSITLAKGEEPGINLRPDEARDLERLLIRLADSLAPEAETP